MESNNKPVVIVLARNYSNGLSVIRSLGAAGYNVDLVASAHRAGTSEIAANSKYVGSSVEIVSKKLDGELNTEFIDAILECKNKYDYKPVIFPTDDYTASVMDANRKTLEPYFVMPSIVNNERSLVESMDKTLQGKLARKSGLLTPKEWIISLMDQIEIPEDMVYPCFCKPIESITGYKKEMAACEDEDELRRHLRKLRKRFADRSVLVQEFLEIDNEIDINGVCLDQEVIIPAIIKKTNVGMHEKGVTLSGKVYPTEELGDLKEKIIDMLREFHYFGMFDMELNIVGDKIYFNEVNFRSGGPNFAYYMSGVNLPALFVKEAYGERHTPEDECVAEYGKSFVYEKVAWHDYMHGYMTKAEFHECISSADFTLLSNDDDPVPGELFTKQIKQEFQRAKVKSVKKFARRVKKKALAPARKAKNKTKGQFRKLKPFVLGFPQVKKENERSAETEHPRILVSGRNYLSNLTMAKALGRAGYEVEVLKIFQTKPKKKSLLKKLKPDAYSKYVKGYYECISFRKERRIVRKLIELADAERKMLLIPADDLIANIADKYLEELSEYYLLPNVNNTPGEIGRLMEKGVQKELAKAAGLPVVNSCVIRAYRGRFEIPETVTYPCFIKPNISKNSSKSRMRKCESREELEAALTEFSARKQIEMIVEDYVEIVRESSILGVSTKAGANGPGYFVAEEGGKEEHRGVALVGRVCPRGDRSELIQKMVDFVGSLGYEGLYDIDLIEDTEGTLYFVEVNMRFGASGYAFLECGVNIPAMFADYMFKNKPIDLDCQVEIVDKTFVSEKVLIEEYAKGRLEKEDMDRILKEVDIHFIEDEDDMRPYKHFKRYFPIAALMKKARE